MANKEAMGPPRVAVALLSAMAIVFVVPAGPVVAAPTPPPGAACAEPFPTYAPAQTAAGETTLPDQHVTMSDGTELALDVHLPAGLPGPFPTIVSITGYGRSGAIASLDGSGLTRHGYAYVFVDDRGTGGSGGQWDAWGPRTQADYHELLDWVVAQPWSDGAVGLTGTSYGGITSLFAAASGHPALRAVFAVVPMADGYRDITFAGGQTNLAFIPAWMGLVTALSVFYAEDADVLVDHVAGTVAFQLSTLVDAAAGGDAAFDGPFWRQRSPIEVTDRIEVPTFLVGGLDDLFQRGTPMLYEALADHTDSRLLIGPWGHLTTGTGLPRDGVPSIGALRLQWLDQHVRGIDTGARCIPPVTQYVRGAEAYRSASSWPVPGLRAQRWHLRRDGRLTTDAPTAGEGGRRYLQLPLTGLCTRSTNQWATMGALAEAPCGSDNRIDEALPLSLTYTSKPVTEPLELNGPIEADVWIVPSSSEALVSVAVSDVAPDGTSRGLTNGLLMASHRRVDEGRSRHRDGQSIQPWHPFGRTDVLPVEPGVPILLPVEVFPTSAVLQPGHRLRVTVAPYDVPHAFPPLPGALDALGGSVTVLSDAEHPSSVVLPIALDAVQGTATEVLSGQTSGAAEVLGATANGAAAPNGSAGHARSLPATGAATPAIAAVCALAVAALGHGLLRRAAARP